MAVMIRYAFALAAAIVGALLTAYSPAFLVRFDGITLLGLAVIALAVLRFLHLRSLERLTMSELKDLPEPVDPKAPSPAYFDVKKVLDFEHAHPRTAGKTEAIRKTFKVSPTRYYSRLLYVIRTEEAIAYNPALVSRLNRAAAIAADIRALRSRSIDLTTAGPADIRARRTDATA